MINNNAREAFELTHFRFGLYKHYKGGLYTAFAIVTHHQTRRPVVVYVSHTYGTTNVRPLGGWREDPDAWLDLIEFPEGSGKKVQRFTYVPREDELPYRSPTPQEP